MCYAEYQKLIQTPIEIKDEVIALHDYTNYKQKDQRIAELEKENKELKNENNEFCDYNKKLREEKQTAVKEFANELYKGLNDLTKHGYTDDQWENICISKYDVEDKIIQLLKERGIE